MQIYSHEDYVTSLIKENLFFIMLMKIPLYKLIIHAF